jgi:serine/threonine protein kinase/tetratricopeptide (TPR) repeat protein
MSRPTDSPTTAFSLLREAFQSPSHGEPKAVEALCAQHPQLAKEIQHLVEEVQTVGRLVRMSPASILDQLKGGGALPPTGEVLERYQLLEEIGRGGMGIVRRALDQGLDRPVAVKVLRDELAQAPDIVERFLDEARITGQLQHPGIVPVYELGTTGSGSPFIAMKLVQGQSLAHLLNERADPSQERGRLLGVLVDVGHALAFAHSKRVIHRDLKPSNVMVGRFGEVQVLDWGLAKVLDRDERDSPEHSHIQAVRCDVSRTGTVIGTPAYMSPEQARGEHEHLDPRTDVFAFGALLCEVLTGHSPYSGSSGVLAQAAAGRLEDAWRRLDACEADAELVELARRCLAPDPERRPADAGAVVAELSAHLASVEERARTSATVLGILADADRLRLEGDLDGARAIAVHARDQLAREPLDPALRSRVEGLVEALREEQQRRRSEGEQRARTQRLVTRLTELRRSTLGLAPAAEVRRDMAQHIEHAFLDFGFQVFVEGPTSLLGSFDPETLAHVLIPALDELAHLLRGEGSADAPRVAALGKLADALDPDVLRREARSTLRRSDRDTLRGLASQPATRDWDPATLVVYLETLDELFRGQDPGDLDDLVSLTSDVLRKYPGDLGLTMELASVLLLKGRVADDREALEEARALLYAARALDPTHGASLVFLAAVEEQLGRPEAGARALEDALAILGTGADMHERALCCMLGIFGYGRQTARRLEQVLEADPERACSWCCLSWTHGMVLPPDERAPARALEAARRAVELDPQLAGGLRTLALALLRAGEAVEALEVLARLGALQPDDLVQSLTRGLALLQVGENGRARGALELAREQLGDRAPRWDEHRLLAELRESFGED